MNSIQIHNVSKNYGEVIALKNINIDITEGELFGLIGPDGAGKTTLFESLVTLSPADSGHSKVCGLDTVNDRKKIRQIVGYMPGKFSLYSDLTVYENLKFFADIFGTSIEEGYELIQDIWVQIEPFKKRPAGKLSGGMKQKLALCCALVHQPKVLFLDEPTTGVDPVSRKEFWEMLKRLKKKNITIFVSTPYMDEAILCDRVALIQNGEIMTIDTPQGVVDSYPHKLYEIKTNNIFQVIKVLNNWDKTHSSNTFGKSIHFVAKDDNITEKQIRSCLTTILLTNEENLPIEIQSISLIKATIEDCFIEFMSTNADAYTDADQNKVINNE
ncbi:MAG: ABC transporter ATP-binding protein [Bacteroidales bacterium]